MDKDFKEFTQELTSIQDWYQAAQQLGEKPEYLKEITDTEATFCQGQPLSPDKKLVMNWDKN